MVRTIVYNNTYIQGILVNLLDNEQATIEVFGKQYTGSLIPSYRKR